MATGFFRAGAEARWKRQPASISTRWRSGAEGWACPTAGTAAGSISRISREMRIQVILLSPRSLVPRPRDGDAVIDGQRLPALLGFPQRGADALEFFGPGRLSRRLLWLPFPPQRRASGRPVAIQILMHDAD